MVKQIFKIIDCLEGDENCNGLNIAISGETIELEQRDKGYIVRTRDGHEAFGSCLHYQQCYQQIISRGIRKSTQIK